MAKLRITSLKENQDLRSALNLIASEIRQVTDYDNKAHLADIGCKTRELSERLARITTKIFERHNNQKIASE